MSAGVRHEPLKPKTALSVADIHARLVQEFSRTEILKHFIPADESKDPKKKLGGESYIVINPAAIARVCAFLKDDPALFFNSLMCLGGLEEAGIEGQEGTYTVVYNLYSFKHRHRVALHVRLPKGAATVKSVQNIWHGANWFEREAFDLLGIHFENHPDLRRLLLPPDWVGHPLRKDYEFPKEYNGISCVRPKLK